VIVRFGYSNGYARNGVTRNQQGKISMITYSDDQLDKSFISSIRSLLVDSLVWNQLDRPRGILRQRLVLLGDVIPDTDDGKLKLLSALFSKYKSSLEERLDYREISQMITDAESHFVLIEIVLKDFRLMCNQIAQETFCRFPLVVNEMQKVSRTLLSTVIRSALEKISMNLIQTHFVLLHAFECDEGKCTRNCAFFSLVNALCSGLVEHTKSFIIAQVQDQLVKYVPLMREPMAVTLERLKLKEKLKVIQKAFALLPKEQPER